MANETEVTNEVKPLLVEDTFYFRAKKPEYDENGIIILPDSHDLVLDKDKKPIGVKRNPVKVALPYVNAAALIAFIESENGETILDYIAELVNDTIYTAAQTQINALIDAGISPTQDDLKTEVLTLDFLATQPKVTGRGIPKDVWIAFKDDFVAVLQAKFKISFDGATKASKLIADDRMSSIKTARPLLETLGKYLDNWFGSTSPESQLAYGAIYEESLKKIALYCDKGEQLMLDSIK